MTGSGILGGILELLTGNLQFLTDNIIALGLSLFALVLGFFSVNYIHKRRQMLHQERMAALIKGLHYAGVARDVFAKPSKPEPRDHLLRGLRWSFGAAGLSTALYGYESMQPVADSGQALSGALVGLIPGAIGLAHLLFGWMCSRRQPVAAPRAYYQTVGRRY